MASKQHKRAAAMPPPISATEKQAVPLTGDGVAHDIVAVDGGSFLEFGDGYPHDELVECPFTGADVKIEYNAVICLFRGIGPFYVTEWYNTRRALMYDLLQRPGAKPAFFRERKPVKVTRNEGELPGSELSDPTVGLRGDGPGAAEIEAKVVEEVARDSI